MFKIITLIWTVLIITAGADDLAPLMVRVAPPQAELFKISKDNSVSLARSILYFLCFFLRNSIL